MKALLFGLDSEKHYISYKVYMQYNAIAIQNVKYNCLAIAVEK